MSSHNVPSQVALCCIEGDDLVYLSSFPESLDSTCYVAPVSNIDSDEPELFLSGRTVVNAVIDQGVAYDDIELKNGLASCLLVLSVEQQQAAGARCGNFFFKVVTAATKRPHTVRVGECFHLQSVRTLQTGLAGAAAVEDVVVELGITVRRPHPLGRLDCAAADKAEHDMANVICKSISDERARREQGPTQSQLDALLRAVIAEAAIRPRDGGEKAMKKRAEKVRSWARKLLQKGAAPPLAGSTPPSDDADLNTMLDLHRAKGQISSLEQKVAALEGQSATKSELAALAAAHVTALEHGLNATKADLAAVIAVQQQDLSAVGAQLAALLALRPAAPPTPFGIAPGESRELGMCLKAPHGLFLVGVPAAVGSRLGKHNCPIGVILIDFGSIKQGVGLVAQPGGNVQVCPIGLTEQSAVAAIRGHLKASPPALVGILVPSDCELVRADPAAQPTGQSKGREDEVIYVIDKTGADMWMMSCFMLATVSHWLWRIKP